MGFEIYIGPFVFELYIGKKMSDKDEVPHNLIVELARH